MSTEPHTTTLRPARRRESGLTLIELMIAVLLALVLTGGIIQVFLGNRATYAFAEGLSRLQENGRYALDFIANETRMAGYFGCLATIGVNDNLNAADFLGDVDVGVQGFDANGTANGGNFAAADVNPAASTDENDWTPALPAELDGLVVPGSDVLIVRRAGSPANALVSPFSDASQLYPTQPDTFLQGQIVLATDCQKASLFQVTNDPAGAVTLAHGTGGGFVPGNSVGAWPAEQLYGLGAEVAPFEVVAFFVGRGAAGTPSLFQTRLRSISSTQWAFGDADELIDSIDTLQVRYGRDADNNTTIDSWETAGVVDAGDNWDQIRGVEISLLARASEEYGTDVDTAVYPVGNVNFDPADDRRLRRVFSTVVALRNRLP